MRLVNIGKDFSYIESRKNPRLLLHAGTHGDEYEVIDIVSDFIKSHEKELPPFIYVPQVSPSAVAAKTRVNKNGKDLNRIFYENSQDDEVQNNIAVMKKGPFNLLVSFHEDPEFREYYIYDVGVDTKPTQSVIDHNAFLKKQGVVLLNGLDDPKDPELGFEFVEGYHKFEHTDADNGMILVWAFNHGFIKHCLLPEIPGKMNLDEKRKIVNSFFEQVIIKYFNKRTI